MTLRAEKRSTKLWWDFRYIWMFISSIWVFSLIPSLFGVWQERWRPIPGTNEIEHFAASGWVRITATVLVVAFIALYLEAMYRMYFGRSSWISDATPRERWSLRLPIMLIATALIFLPVPTKVWEAPFAGTMMFVVIVWTLTAPPERAFSAVIISTLLTALILTIAFDGGRAFNLSIYSLAFGFFTSGYVINRGLINELQLERSRVRDQAVTEERFRLARDLHDTVGHSMTQITLKAELARRILPDDPARAATELEDIEQLSRSLSAEVRRSIAGEVDLTLPVEIGRARELLASMGIEVSVGGDVESFPPEVADVLAWCLREGVMNTIKHSGATSCEIEFAADSDHYHLAIRDNGTNQIVENKTGQGIQGMTQRVQGLNGEVWLETIESGHMLSIRIPA